MSPGSLGSNAQRLSLRGFIVAKEKLYSVDPGCSGSYCGIDHPSGEVWIRSYSLDCIHSAETSNLLLEIVQRSEAVGDGLDVGVGSQKLAFGGDHCRCRSSVLG